MPSSETGRQRLFLSADDGSVVAMRDEQRGEMITMSDELRGESGQTRTSLAGAILLMEKRLITEMRSLHEDLVQRIALIGETRPAVEEPGALNRVRPRRPRKAR